MRATRSKNEIRFSGLGSAEVAALWCARAHQDPVWAGFEEASGAAEHLSASASFDGASTDTDSASTDGGSSDGAPDAVSCGETDDDTVAVAAPPPKAGRGTRGVAKKAGPATSRRISRPPDRKPAWPRAPQLRRAEHAAMRVARIALTAQLLCEKSVREAELAAPQR